jgi:hypothetical protein
LHERVEDALSQRVFGNVTTDKLIALAGFSPDKPAVTLGDLVDWFYSYLDFTKVWSRRIIAEAVSSAIGAARAGYVVGLISSDATLEVREPRMIRIGETLPADEIDLSGDAALLEADYAQHLLDALRSPTPPTAASTPPATTIPVSSEPGSRQAPAGVRAAPATESSQQKATESVARVDLKATVGKAGFFDLNRALSWLRDHAAQVEVEIAIRAEANDAGFDRVQLRNGVIEPLEEGSTHIDIDMR